MKTNATLRQSLGVFLLVRMGPAKRREQLSISGPRWSQPSLSQLSIGNASVRDHNSISFGYLLQSNQFKDWGIGECSRPAVTFFNQSQRVAVNLNVVSDINAWNHRSRVFGNGRPDG